MEVKLYVSPIPSKKYRAIWFEDDTPVRSVDFGAKGYRDFTLINSPKSKFYLPKREDRLKVRSEYLRRHSGGREDWDDPFTAGSLSRWVLWNAPTLRKSWEHYKKRFGFV